MFWPREPKLSTVYINLNTTQWPNRYFSYIYIGTYFSNVFTTVILWSLIMIIFSFVALFNKKVQSMIFEIKLVIPTVIIMLGYTVVCRIGFAVDVPLEPTWTYQMNMDINTNYWALLGFFP